MKVNLYNGKFLNCSDSGVYSIHDRNQDTITIISQEDAISTLVSAVRDMGHWCQVAKDILPEDLFEEINDAVAAE